MAASAAKEATRYDVHASFIQLMDDYLSGKLATEEYAAARQQFFRERFPSVLEAGTNHNLVSRRDDNGQARATLPWDTHRDLNGQADDERVTRPAGALVLRGCVAFRG